MQVRHSAHQAARTTHVAAPHGCVAAGGVLRAFVRQFDDSPAKAAYLKSP